KKKTKPETGNVEQQPTSSASMTPPTTKGQVSGVNKRNQTKEKIPTGLYYWETTQGDVQHPVDLLMDQHGELFLIQKGKRKGKGVVYWSHKINMDMYSLMVSDGVHVYVDAGEDMFPFVHTRDQTPKVISHTSLEDLKEILKRKLKRTYRDDEIHATSELVERHLNYQTGEQVCESNPDRFTITITRYEISLSSTGHPPRSRLLFAYVKAIFPNVDFPCTVLYARNLDEFSKICHDYDIERLPGGRTIDDLLWMQEYATKMILVDPERKKHTANGLYEGENAIVIRIKRTDNIMNKIKKLRCYDDNDNVLHFYGWQEEDDHYHLAFERCDETLEDFLSRANNFTVISSKMAPLRLDIIRGIAKGVLSLQRKGINHGNLKPDNIFIKDNTIAKLGPCSFIFEDEDDEHKGGSLNANMQDLAKIILHCTSGGIYKVSDQKVQVDELNLCEMVEARDLIVKILNESILTVSALLAHHFFWGTIKRLCFMVDFSEHIHNQKDNAQIVLEVTRECRKNIVYNTRWDTKMLKSSLFSEMIAYRVKQRLPEYEYQEPRSLVRFMRNAFNHHGSFTQDVYTEIGYSKLDMWAYFEKTFPRLLGSLYEAGQSDHSDIPSSETYYVSVEDEDETIGKTDEGLTGGRTIEEFYPIRTSRKTMISVDPEAKWTNNTTNGLYDGVNKCKHTLEEYVTRHNFSEFSGSKSLQLDILRGIAKGVFSLKSQDRYHGNLRPNNVFIDAYGIAKLGVGRFIFEEEIEEKKVEDKGGSFSMNMQDFAKILLHCTSGGFYVLSDQKVGDNELKLCKIVEARDLIEKIIENRIVTLHQVLGHHFFWGTLERISFMGDFSNHVNRVGPKARISGGVTKKLAQKKVFVNRWDLNYLPNNLVQAVATNAYNLGLPPYIYTDWQSLLRFMKNVFNHYNSIPKHIRDGIGPGKAAMETHFRTSFPELLNILFNEGRPHRHTMNNFSINYLDDVVFRASGNKGKNQVAC
ncbi:serine/threonine-protein kinase/endoribonuclease IRE1a, partial [Tanacetum coccineum]